MNGLYNYEITQLKRMAIAIAQSSLIFASNGLYQ
jgi:hypothetical protein